MKTFALILFLSAALALLARAQDPNLSQLMGALNAMMSARTNEAPAEVVDFRKLRDLLPEKVGNYARKKAGGEKTALMGVTLSMAEGQYADGNALLTIKLTDYGGSGFAGMMASAWVMTEIDRESDSGYERTIKIGPHRGIERFDSDARFGELQLLVGSRHMVEITVRDGKPEDLRAAADALALDALSALN